MGKEKKPKFNEYPKTLMILLLVFSWMLFCMEDESVFKKQIFFARVDFKFSTLRVLESLNLKVFYCENMPNW